MDTFTLEVKIPQRLRELGFSDEEICREVPLLLVLKRFRQGAVSSSRAAGILGLSRRDFLELLTRERIPIYDPSDEELQDEHHTIQRLGSAKP